MTDKQLERLKNATDTTLDAVDKAFSPAEKFYDEAMSENADCFIPEDNNPYPLCVGRGNSECEDCCLYMNYTEKHDPYEGVDD